MLFTFYHYRFLDVKFIIFQLLSALFFWLILPVFIKQPIYRDDLSTLKGKRFYISAELLIWVYRTILHSNS